MAEQLPKTCRLPIDLLLRAIPDANAGFRHAEIVVQQRLYNFLMAESILFIAAAAILATSATAERMFFLGTLAALGFALSITWTALGLRQRKFIELHLEIVESLEGEIEEDLSPLRVSTPIAELRRGGPVLLPKSRKPLSLSRIEKLVNPSYLLFAAPASFALAFAVLLIIAICGWSSG